MARVYLCADDRMETDPGTDEKGTEMKGKPSTEYTATLCKKEKGKHPIITPSVIYEKQYKEILKIIEHVQHKGERQR